MIGFVFVEEDGFRTSKDLEKWIDFGLEFSKYGVVKSKKKKLLTNLKYLNKTEHSKQR